MMVSEVSMQESAAEIELTVEREANHIQASQSLDSLSIDDLAGAEGSVHALLEVTPVFFGKCAICYISPPDETGLFKRWNIDPRPA